LAGNFKAKDNPEDLDTDGRLILNITINRMGG
jgi:hypothetical protein